MTENDNVDAFINDWEINQKSGIISHKSGIGFRYIANGENGKPRVEILNLPKWFSSEMKQGKSYDECNAKLKDLNNQFVLIQENILARTEKNSETQSPVITRGGYER